MAIAVGDKLEVKARFSYHGSIVMNVFYVSCGSPGSSDADVKDDMVAWINDGYATVEDVQSTELIATDIDVINFTQAYHIGSDTWLSYTGGTVATEGMPGQDAALVSFPSPTLGARGRKFIPGFLEAVHSAGLWQSAALTAMGDFGFYFFDTFTGFATGDTYTPMSARPTGSPGLYVFQPFTGFSVSSVVARMGSRKRGVGI